MASSSGRSLIRMAVALACATLLISLSSPLSAQQVATRAPQRAATDYVVGPQDVLTITSYDQADLSGKFTIEADGAFTCASSKTAAFPRMRCCATATRFLSRAPKASTCSAR